MFRLTLLRARGAASGVLGDVDSLAVSDVELKEELLLDNSLLDGRLVANCRTDDHKVRFDFLTYTVVKLVLFYIVQDNNICRQTKGIISIQGHAFNSQKDKPVKWTRRGRRSPCAPRAAEGPGDSRPDAACAFCHYQ